MFNNFFSCTRKEDSIQGTVTKNTSWVNTEDNKHEQMQRKIFLTDKVT